MEKDAMNSDLTTLLELNEDYIRSVQSSDVERFKEILADDFRALFPTARSSTAHASWSRRRCRSGSRTSRRTTSTSGSW
jgi:transposase